MRSHTIIGIIFIVVMLIAPIILVGNIVDLSFSKNETITIVEKSEQSPLKITLNAKNGIITIKKNTTVSGWVVRATYKESDKPPEINFSNGELAVNLDNGRIMIDYNSTSEIQINILNGVITVVTSKDNINLHGYMLNGKVHLIFIESNITINFKLTNGGLTFNSVGSKLNGSLKVTNGYIDALVQSSGGGKIDYTVESGNALVYAPNYNITVTKSDNGESGTLTRNGNDIDLDLHITNGDLSLIVTTSGSGEGRT